MSRILFFAICCLSSISFAQTAPAPACSSLALSGWSMTLDQGMAIGLAISGLFCVAGIFRQLMRVGPDRDE